MSTFDSSNWRNPAPAGLDAKLLAKPDYICPAFEVPGTDATDAVSRLKSQKFAAITKDEAVKYLDANVPIPGRGNYYLIRAISNDEPGAFQVSQVGSTTLVHFAAMGSMRVRSRNCVVVARLPRKPGEVYIEASIDD